MQIVHCNYQLRIRNSSCSKSKRFRAVSHRLVAIDFARNHFHHPPALTEAGGQTGNVLAKLDLPLKLWCLNGTNGQSVGDL